MASASRLSDALPGKSAHVWQKLRPERRRIDAGQRLELQAAIADRLQIERRGGAP